jgi:hypothetical protein
MELKNLEADLLPIDQLPHLRFQEESLERSQKIIDILNKRKSLLKEMLEATIDPLHTVSVYEQNEKELLLIKTDIELAKTHTDIIKKKEYVKDLRNNLVAVLKEMDEKWADLIEVAESLKEANENIDKLLNTINMVFFNENWEYAIDFYLNLKHLVYPPIDEPKEVKKLSKV